jgi:tol-pal system protein YbgF
MSLSKPALFARNLLVAGCVFPLTLIAAPLDTSSMTLDQRLQRLERMIDNQNAAQMMFSIERVQREVESLRGDLDEVMYDLQQLKRQQKDLYLDLDQRVQQLETQGVAPSSMAPAMAADVLPSDGSVVIAPVSPGFAGDGAVEAVTESEPVQEITLDEAGLYQKAFSELKNKQYQQALVSLQLFLQTYPAGAYSDNAQYWLGEVHYVMKDYQAAVAGFEKVIAEFPDSAKVPGSYLKMGYSHIELQEWKKAEAALMLVVSKFPASSSARLAERRIQQLKLDGRI